MTTHTEPTLNAIADAAAALYDEASFWYAGAETTLTRASLTFSAAGAAGAHARQLALPGRAWSQMFTIVVPDGVLVDEYRLHGTGVESARSIPRVTGPRSWEFSVPVDAVQNP